MRLAGLTSRVRIVDALAIGAAALLALKATSFFLAPEAPAGTDESGLPSFARVLAHARTNHVVPDPAPPGSPSERSIRERLSERREELRGTSNDLDSRERLIEEVERRLDAEAAERRAAEERRPDPGAAATADAETAILKGVVTMYETMKPKEAARIFDRLPQDVLVPVVRRINPRKMAEILAAMTPDMAEKLTVALARRDRPALDDRQTGLSPGELPAIEPERRPILGRSSPRPNG